MENILYISLYTLNLKECYLANTKVILNNIENISDAKIEMLEYDEHVKYFKQNFRNQHLYLKSI